MYGLRLSSPTALRRAVLAFAIGAYLAGTLAGLSVYPRVGVDEPWIAAAPFKLATQGILGNDLFTGLAGMERHHYQHMPVYPILEAGVFKAFGVGVVQMRMLSVLFGLALLLVTFSVGRQIGGERVGLLAVLILLVLRIDDGGEGTGILLLDRARINRYDIAVPVFGLWAFALVPLARTARAWTHFAVGALCGLSSLSHLYGIFWLVAPVASLVCAQRTRERVSAMSLTTAGFAAAWLPWAAFISLDWQDFQGQMRTVSERLDVFSPGFYVANTFTVEGPLSVGWLLAAVTSLPFWRIGAWAALVGVPVAAVTMVRRPDVWVTPHARVFALVAMAQCLLFVVLLRAKTINYMIALWPLGALALSWLAVWLWERRHRSLRIALVVLALAIAGEGGLRLVHARTVASRMTSYDWFTAEVAQCIPPGSRVLGLSHYWLGLRQFDYRTWLLPLYETNPRFTDTPVPFAASLSRVNADVILVDRYIEDLFVQTSSPSDPLHRLKVDFDAFSAERRLVPVCVIRDRTYGAMQVYFVGDRVASPRPPFRREP
jgi:4-amino-4-deoxy-L-arabinose transferase-like glycosyltransferase